eukprot:8315132-Pyramimonas_sp.AAC.1
MWLRTACRYCCRRGNDMLIRSKLMHAPPTDLSDATFYPWISRCATLRRLSKWDAVYKSKQQRCLPATQLDA